MAMSDMYQAEVPLYGTLLKMVESVNQDMLGKHPYLKDELQQTKNLKRISQERHGAIRLGTQQELFNIRRLFAVMGMYPVAYYDLSVAGIPVHSTAFRPISQQALSANPFRVFTSLLRTELIADQVLREKATAILDARQIFSDDLLELIDIAEQQNGLQEQQAAHFIAKSLDVFRWHEEALVDIETYEELKQSHPLVADVVSFKGPHINHLTPATLNIDQIQHTMLQQGIDSKAIVEGPPTRKCPVLLRQTSFKALVEAVRFRDKKGSSEDGFHTARFGEVEQRGIALTPKGQALYDRLLLQTREKITPLGDGSNAQDYMQTLEQNFELFPDSYKALYQQELAYFFHSVTNKADNNNAASDMSLEELIELGFVRYDPILYEDFLPVSAAGIFQSNLGNNEEGKSIRSSNQAEFEKALGVKVENQFKLYEKAQQQSIQHCLETLSK